MSDIPSIISQTIDETYLELLEIFAKRDRRKLENNTYATYSRASGSITIRYHETDILTYPGDGTFVLDTGGWHTVTTAARYRNWLPRGWFVSNDRGAWNLYGNTGGRISFGSGLGTYPETKPLFRVWDSMVIRDTPRVFNVNYRAAPDFKASDDLASTLARMISEYADLYDADTLRGLFGDNLEAVDTRGDCWYCLGLGSDYVGHLLSHLTEGYTMVTLLRNAYKSRGYGSPDFVLQLGISDALKGRPDSPFSIRANVIRYLETQLVPYGIPKVSAVDVVNSIMDATVSA